MAVKVDYLVAPCYGVSQITNAVLVKIGPTFMYLDFHEKWKEDCFHHLASMEKDHDLPRLLQFHLDSNGLIVGYDYNRPESWLWTWEVEI